MNPASAPPLARRPWLTFKNEINWSHVIWALTVCGALAVAFIQYTSLIQEDSKRITANEAQLDKLRADLAAAKDERLALREIIRDISSDTKALNASIDRLAASIADLSRRSDLMADQITTIRENVARLGARLGQMNNGLTTAETPQQGQ